MYVAAAIRDFVEVILFLNPVNFINLSRLFVSPNVSSFS